MTAVVDTRLQWVRAGDEFRRDYRRHLGFALTLSVGAHAILLGCWWLASVLAPGAVPRLHLPIITGTYLFGPPPIYDYPSGRTLFPPGATPFPSVGIPVPVPDVSLSPEQTASTLNGLLPSGAIFDPNGNQPGVVIPGTVPASTPPADSAPGLDEFIPVDKEPQMISNIASFIVYPELARRANIEGTVQVRARIRRDGTVADVVILKSDAAVLDDAAVDAIRKCRFTPALAHEAPVEVWMSFPIRFRLR